MATVKYPCIVCLEQECLGADCPANNGQAEEYQARLKALVNKEIPLDSEEEA